MLCRMSIRPVRPALMQNASPMNRLALRSGAWPCSLTNPERALAASILLIGMPVSIASQTDRTALHMAAWHGQLPLVKRLVEEFKISPLSQRSVSVVSVRCASLLRFVVDPWARFARWLDLLFSLYPDRGECIQTSVTNASEPVPLLLQLVVPFISSLANPGRLHAAARGCLPRPPRRREVPAPSGKERAARGEQGSRSSLFLDRASSFRSFCLVLRFLSRIVVPRSPRPVFDSCFPGFGRPPGLVEGKPTPAPLFAERRDSVRALLLSILCRQEPRRCGSPRNKVASPLAALPGFCFVRCHGRERAHFCVNGSARA